MNYRSVYENVWLYSKYYADMIAMSVRLMENDESYASLLVIFNTLELIFKSIRENDSYNFSDNTKWMYKNGYLTVDEFEYINSENGIRVLRNKMTHKDFYEYIIIIDEIVYPFTEKDTWDVICQSIVPKITNIINNIISKRLIK